MQRVARFLVTGAVVAGAAWACLGRAHPAGVGEGEPAPAFRLPRLDGATFDSSALRGRVVVLNFWATWCPPCVEEMPSLERLHRAMSAEGLSVVAVSVDEEPQELRRFVERQRLTLTVLRDPGTHATARAYGVEGFPTTFVIDPGGIVRGVYVGPSEWDTPGALSTLRKLLAPRRPAPATSTTTTAP